MPQTEPPLLEVRDLSVRYPGVVALDRLNLEVAAGEVLGVLGESGCGKSTLATAVLGLLPSGGEVVEGSVRFRGRELVGLAERELRRVRGAQISLVFQEPTLALHPTRRVGEQVVEVIRAHWPRDRGRWSKKLARQSAEELLREVGFRGEDGVYHTYPHQLSGGQRQRVVLAQALACRPALVMADEPTASLDSTIQKQVLELLGTLRQRFEVAFLFISHDPLVLAEVADRILVMYAGRRVEEGPASEVLRAPLHPYTRGLLESLPQPLERGELPALPGTSPVVRERRPGCLFEPRCPLRLERCRNQDPQEAAREPGHKVWCFNDAWRGGEKTADGD